MAAAGTPNSAARRRVRFEDHAAVVEDQHRVGGIEEHRSELLLALEQGEFGLDAGGDVDQESAQLDERAVAVELTDHGFDHRDHPAIAPAQPAAVMLEAAARADRFDEAIAIAGLVVQRTHVAADRVGDRREPEEPRERTVARQQLAIGTGDVDAEQGAFEQLAVALFQRHRVDFGRPRQGGRRKHDGGISHDRRRAAGGGATSAR